MYVAPQLCALRISNVRVGRRPTRSLAVGSGVRRSRSLIGTPSLFTIRRVIFRTAVFARRQRFGTTWLRSSRLGCLSLWARSVWFHPVAPRVCPPRICVVAADLCTHGLVHCGAGFRSYGLIFVLATFCTTWLFAGRIVLRTLWLCHGFAWLRSSWFRMLRVRHGPHRISILFVFGRPCEPRLDTGFTKLMQHGLFYFSL